MLEKTPLICKDDQSLAFPTFRKLFKPQHKVFLHTVEFYQIIIFATAHLLTIDFSPNLGNPFSLALFIDLMLVSRDTWGQGFLPTRAIYSLSYAVFEGASKD